jgi:two-component system LytT family sensor kinase
VVAISARLNQDRLVIAVQDDGPGVSADAESGVGLSNTRARLDALYGDAASLDLASPPGGGARAEMTLPFRMAGGDALHG